VIDGWKKYSPPVVVTKRAMSAMWLGRPPGSVNDPVAGDWVMIGSWPVPASGKSGSFTKWRWTVSNWREIDAW
jgi:hypothetical protein